MSIVQKWRVVTNHLPEDNIMSDFGNIYKASWFGYYDNSIGWGISYSLFKKRVIKDGGKIEMQRSMKKDKSMFI